MSKKNCSFDSDWLKDPRFSRWIVKETSSAMKARCIICSCNFTLSNMGDGIVISHSKGKKNI